MAAIDAPEPSDRDVTIRDHFCRPSSCMSEKGKESWPINALSHDSYAKAWGHIIGIETGWFAHDRAGFLGWTAVGRDRFPPAPRIPRELAPFVPPTPAKPALLADEIAPRPRAEAPATRSLLTSRIPTCEVSCFPLKKDQR